MAGAEPTSTLEARIAELEAEVADWKTYAAELGRQLATLRSANRAPKERDSTPGFDTFWQAWPASSRKVDKKRCVARWIAAGLEPLTAEIVAHVEAMKLSADWTKSGGQYVPAPLVYLNQERYKAPPAAAGITVGSLAGIRYNTEGIDDDGHFH